MDRAFSPDRVVAAFKERAPCGRVDLLTELQRRDAQREKIDLRPVQKNSTGPEWSGFETVPITQCVVSHEMGLALERYISEVDAEVAVALAALCPQTTFAYLLLPRLACQVGNTMRMARLRWPGCTGVYAVFPASGDQHALLMIDKVHLRIVKTLLLSLCDTALPKYPIMGYNTMFAPVVSSLLVATQSSGGEHSATNYELLRYVTTNEVSYFWGAYTLASYVAHIAIYLDQRSLLHVPLPTDKGFGLLTSLSDAILLLAGATDAKFQRAIIKSCDHYRTRRTMYSALAALVLRWPTGMKRHSTHIMRKTEVHTLHAQVNCDRMMHKYPTLHHIITNISHMTPVKRRTFNKSGQEVDQEYYMIGCHLVTEMDPVFYIYEFLLDEGSEMLPKLRRKLLLAISLDTPAPMKPLALRRRDKRGFLDGDSRLTGRAITKWATEKYDSTWVNLDARHPLYSKMAIESSYDAPEIADIVFKFYGYSDAALSCNGKNSGPLNLPCQMNHGRLYSSMGIFPNFPLEQVCPIDYRAATASQVRGTMLCVEDAFIVLRPEEGYYSKEWAALPQWVLAEAYSGHGDKYFEAVKQVLGDAQAKVAARGKGAKVSDVAPRLRPPQQELLELQMVRRRRKKPEKIQQKKPEVVGGGFSAMLAKMAK